MAEKAKENKQFQMPHLLFLLLGMMIVMMILTYILPAGEFVEVAEGVKEYVRVDRTPVSPWDMLMYIYTGLCNSGTIIAILLASGGAITVVLGTGALERVIDGCVYTLRDAGVTVLVPIMFFLMALLGGFGGSDAMIAVVPIGVMFAKKLRLDPIAGASISLLGTLTGFACRPNVYTTQAFVEDVVLYSGYTERVVILVFTAAVGAVYVTFYARKVAKDPTRSAMGDTAWMAELGDVGELQETRIDGKDLLITLLFIGQFPVAIYLNLSKGMGQGAMPAVMIPVAILCGFINGMKANEIGKQFEKGVAGMGFIAFVIGFAGAISLVMRNGKILDTIAYYACLPLMKLNKGLAAIGISFVVTILNFFIPSASAKAAAIMPLVAPMAENLGITGQVAVQAYQIGDGMCNAISPFLGWTMGGLAVAKVPYQKWVRWVLPYIAFMLVLQWSILFYLTSIGWTGM